MIDRKLLHVRWRRQPSRTLHRIVAGAQDRRRNGAAMLQVSWRALAA
jgi:hypothetical protein